MVGAGERFGRTVVNCVWAPAQPLPPRDHCTKFIQNANYYLWILRLTTEDLSPVGLEFPVPLYTLKRLGYSISLLDFCSGFRRDPVSPFCCARVCVLQACTLEKLWTFPSPCIRTSFTRAWCNQLTQARKKNHARGFLLHNWRGGPREPGHKSLQSLKV